jgi:hypothetical protein
MYAVLYMSSKAVSSERTFHPRPLAALCCPAYAGTWRRPEANLKSPELSDLVLSSDCAQPDDMRIASQLERDSHLKRFDKPRTVARITA